MAGAGSAGHKAAHSAPAYTQRHGRRIIPHNDQIRRAGLPDPDRRPGQAGLADVSRPSEQTPDIAARPPHPEPQPC